MFRGEALPHFGRRGVGKPGTPLHSTVQPRSVVLIQWLFGREAAILGIRFSSTRRREGLAHCGRGEALLSAAYFAPTVQPRSVMMMRIEWLFGSGPPVDGRRMNHFRLPNDLGGEAE